MKRIKYNRFGASNALGRVLACCMACACAAFGETITDLTDYIYLKTADVASDPSSFVNGAHWSDGNAPHGDADYIVQGAKQLRTDTVPVNGVFGGRSLTLDNGYLNLKVNNAQFTINDLRLYNESRIWNGNAYSTQTIIGKITVLGTEASPPRIGLANNSRCVVLRGELVGGEDAVLRIGQNPGDGLLVEAMPSYAFLYATNETGNCGRYLGRFLSTDRHGYFVVQNENALGDGDTAAHGSVLTLQNGGGFMGQGGLVLTNTAYSITINGSGTIGAYSAGGAHTADLPTGGSTAGLYIGGGVEIKGKNGNDTLEIWGPGGATALNDVRLSGIVQIRKPAYAVNGSPFNSALRFLADYNYPEIPVVVDSGANQIAGWCENIGPVSLSERNSLSPGVGAKSVGTLGMESLIMANGASLIASIYQQEDGSVTSDLIRVKGNLTKGSNPIEIQFDCFPSGTNGVVKGRLLTAANLGTAGGLTVDDFTWRIQDASLNNIVTGELSIEQDADGTNYLFFTRTSTMPVYLTGLDTGGLTGSSFDRGTNWDNKKTPDAEHDYIVPNGQLLRCYVDAIPFKGRSLSVQEGGDFSICGVKAVVNDLRAYPGARFSTRTSNLLNQLQGGLSVYSTTAKPLDFMIEGGASARQLTLGASLVGGNDARVRFRCYTKGPAVGSDTFTGGKFVINGDNSAYKGKITIHQENILAEFANETALGGPADAFAADRLILSSNGTFCCNSTYTLSDPTRGITLQAPDNPANYSKGGGNFEVTAGNTLTIQNVITGNGSLRKSGDGNLVLDATNATFSGVVQPKEGKLVVRNKDALGTGTIKPFADGILRIETVDGVTLTPAEPFDASGSGVLNVELAAFDAPSSGKIEANVFTLADATTFDTSSVQIVAPALGNRYKIEVATKATAAGLVVYATATPRGMTILFR